MYNRIRWWVQATRSEGYLEDLFIISGLILVDIQADLVAGYLEFLIGQFDNFTGLFICRGAVDFFQVCG